MTPTCPLRLTSRLRWEAIREGRAYLRDHPGAESFEISDHVFSFLLSDEERYGTADYEAIEISDYAYGIGNFVTGGRSW